MPANPTVWISICAYNAEKTIGRAIESILNQTYQKVRCVIRDNGSTDSTLDICQDYARRDSRVQVLHNRINHVFDDSPEEQTAMRIERSIRCHAPPVIPENDYICILDADDAYSTQFFEHAIAFAEENHLDIVAGQTEMFDQKTGKLLNRKGIDNTLVIEGQDFSEFFPLYHWFLRQLWGKLIRPNVLTGSLSFLDSIMQKYGISELNYGSDTLHILYAASQSKKIGILPETGYHYYIQEKSVSRTMPPNRVESDWILNSETERFLMDKCGFISRQNREFLDRVYANAVKDTVHVIFHTANPMEDKLREYWRMAEHPITKETFAHSLEEVTSAQKELLFAALSCYGAKNADEVLPAVIGTCAPACKAAITPERISLLFLKPTLMEALLENDPEAMLVTLLDMLRANEQSKKYDLCAMVQALCADKPLLRDICDKKFLRRYGKFCLSVWREQYMEALDAMTGLLLDGEKADDTFLQLYLSLAALQNQPDAFVFGKVQLAQMYLRTGKKDDCQTILSELAEMGVPDNEEIAKLKNACS